MDIQILPDADTLAGAAADFIIHAAQAAIKERGRFTIALAGGHTPKAAYTLLAAPERAGLIDWTRTFVFFGDERFGSPDSADSNYAMAKQALLEKVPIPSFQVFPMPADDTAEEAVRAREYVQTLAEFFGIPPHGLPPPLDLILLGLGDDGHTASLFPGAPATAITDAWVTSTPPGTLPPPVDRLTFTFPILNAAHQVMFLVSGSGKATIVADVLEGGKTKEEHPALGVQPVPGTLTWLLDNAAAAKLQNRI
jgi:6-phosphogluconolactonase